MFLKVQETIVNTKRISFITKESEEKNHFVKIYCNNAAMSIPFTDEIDRNDFFDILYEAIRPSVWERIYKYFFGAA